MIERPFDLLNESRNKKVLVYCKDGKIFSGKLMAFDLNINLALEDMREIGKTGKEIKRFGFCFIKGNNVSFISPS